MSRVDSVRLAIEKARATGHRPDRRRAGLRRVLPVLRRPAARGRRGRHRDHPAGRLGARPRGRRGRRRGRHLDGLHAPPPLPALGRRALAHAVEHARPDRRQRVGDGFARRLRLATEAEVQVALHHPHERARGLARRRAAGCARRRSPPRCGARWRRRSAARARCTPARPRGRRLRASASARMTGPCSAYTSTMPSSASRAELRPSPVPRSQRSDIANSSAPRCSTTCSTRWWRSRK